MLFDYGYVVQKVPQFVLLVVSSCVVRGGGVFFFFWNEKQIKRAGSTMLEHGIS